MNTSTDIHPDHVLEALLAKGGRTQRLENLSRLQEICRKQYEGSRDFSFSIIGRLCEAEGILKSRVLYNASSEDYRTLISAWSAYAGPAISKPPKAKKELASHEYLRRIEDPAIRFIMQGIIAERDKLKAQVNVLKTNANITIDQRPMGVSKSSADLMVVLPQLTDTERNAFNKAISPEFLACEHWAEGIHGEIRNERGRLIFDVGFTKAIRKVLGE